MTSVPLSTKGAARSGSACTAPARPVMVAGKTIGETISTDPNYSTLNTLLSAVGVDVDAAGGGTLFAPTNRAFSGLRPGFLEELSANSNGAARTLLLRHLLPGAGMSVSDMKKAGCGFWYTVPGGPLSFEAGGMAQIQVGSAKLASTDEDVCDNGVIHSMDDVICDLPRTIFEPLSINQQLASVTPSPATTVTVPAKESSSIRARQAAGYVSTVGGRRAMGLMKQLPFWMYGPPFNAAKQEEFEPISIAQPSSGTGIDYQLMPPGSVVVTPDEVSADKLNPVSGMSKYIGKTQRLVEGDGLSDYSKLDNL